MLNENAKKWVEALRSGEYKQGHGQLHDLNNNFCCLGVACDLAVKAGVIPSATRCAEWYTYGIHTASVPFVVKDWLGLVEINGEYRESSLTIKNDNGETFSTIADIIESEPDGLFNVVA